MARAFKWDRAAQRLRYQADSKAKEIGPVADELRRQGMTLAEVMDELNRRVRYSSSPGRADAAGRRINLAQGPMMHDVVHRTGSLDSVAVRCA